MDHLLLRFLVWMLLLPAAWLVFYNLSLALLALRRRDLALLPEASELPRFALVMPAHDEADTIDEALRACTALDYPADRYQLLVIADNCNDRTAEVVRKAGVRCWERRDRQRRGKGYALRFALDQLVHENFDAFVVLDADCWLDPDALQVFARELASGHEVLQANYMVSNPDATPISYVVAVGNAIENDLYYRSKSELGWVVSLRGTGMVFSRGVLEDHPWGAYSIVEDLDYTLELYRAGRAVHFVPEVSVHSPFPETAEQLRVQRERWAGGNVEMSKGSALRLLAEGLVTGRWLVADMGMTILSQSRPLLLVLLWAGLGLSLVEWWLSRDAFASRAVAASLSLNLTFVAYLLSGVGVLGITGHRLSLLLRAPLVLLRLVGISVRSAMGGGSSGWERTPRG